jgi:hypothetical protein
MLDLRRLIFGIASDLLRSQVELEAEILVLRQQINALRLEAENAVLRHQLIVLRRQLRGRVKLANSDRCS